MPILDVEIVGELPSERREGIAQRVADAAGKALGSRAQGTWAKVRFLAPDAYAENEETDPEIRPVFVRLIKRDATEGEALEREVAALTDAVARESGRPRENVHVIYEPPGKGRVAFGGELVR